MAGIQLLVLIKKQHKAAMDNARENPKERLEQNWINRTGGQTE